MVGRFGGNRNRRAISDSPGLSYAACSVGSAFVTKPSVQRHSMITTGSPATTGIVSIAVSLTVHSVLPAKVEYRRPSVKLESRVWLPLARRNPGSRAKARCPVHHCGKAHELGARLHAGARLTRDTLPCNPFARPSAEYAVASSLRTHQSGSKSCGQYH